MTSDSAAGFLLRTCLFRLLVGKTGHMDTFLQGVEASVKGQSCELCKRQDSLARGKRTLLA